MMSDFRGKDAFTADISFKRANQKVQEECFGQDSEDDTRPVSKDMQVFYKHMSQLEWTPDKGGLMKLMADWEANGCHGAMANSGVSPLHWAMDHSLAEKQEDDYKKIFTQHVQEIFANQSSITFFDENAVHMPETFLEAVSAVRGPNAWQAAPPCIEGSNAEEKEQLLDPIVNLRPGTNIPTLYPMQPGAGGPYVPVPLDGQPKPLQCRGGKGGRSKPVDSGHA